MQLPQYYREGFFSHDTLFHAELPGGRTGVAGTPIPYTVHGDSFLTTLLLACFLIMVYAVVSTRRFITNHVSSFLYVKHEGSSELSETATELRFQLTQLLITCILLSVICYFYSLRFVGQTYILSSNYLLIAIFLAMAMGYFLLKMLSYTIVHEVFFDGKRNVQWLKSYLFITSFEGILVFPAVIAIAYLGLAVRNVAIYLLAVLVIVKLLTIYKTYLIFFRTKVAKLQIILYFCTLEIIPLLTFIGALRMVADNLKVNF